MTDERQPLTREQKRTYLKRSGTHCPYCDDNQVEGVSGVEIDGGGAWQRVRCTNCHKEWLDVYTLTGIQEVID